MEFFSMIYVSSDLHGYPLSDFKKLLEKANFNDSDFLFILGDVIDRGDDGVNILRWLLVQPNVELILGNHESMLLSCSFIFDEITDDSLASFDTQKMDLLTTWISNGAEITLKELKKLSKSSPETIEDILDYLHDTPLYETVSTKSGNFLLTHSGLGNFSKNKKLSQYTVDELLWNRPDIEESYFDKFITVFGHTPIEYYDNKRKNQILKTSTWIDIDTGAGNGGAPCLLRLDDMKEFYI